MAHLRRDHRLRLRHLQPLITASQVVAAVTSVEPAHKARLPRLYHMSRNRLTRPRDRQGSAVYVIDDPAPNAFAAGRSPEHAYVAVTTGLLQLMTSASSKACSPTRSSHVRNRDVRLMTLVAVLVGVIALVSDFLSVWRSGAAAASPADRRARRTRPRDRRADHHADHRLPHPARRFRRREYLASASAAEITGDGEGLALALRKLQDDTDQTVTRRTRGAHLHRKPAEPGLRAQDAVRGRVRTHQPLEAGVAALRGFDRR